MFTSPYTSWSRGGGKILTLPETIKFPKKTPSVLSWVSACTPPQPNLRLKSHMVMNSLIWANLWKQGAESKRRGCWQALTPIMTRSDGRGILKAYNKSHSSDKESPWLKLKLKYHCIGWGTVCWEHSIWRNARSKMLETRNSACWDLHCDLCHSHALHGNT